MQKAADMFGFDIDGYKAARLVVMVGLIIAAIGFALVVATGAIVNMVDCLRAEFEIADNDLENDLELLFTMISGFVLLAVVAAVFFLNYFTHQWATEARKDYSKKSALACASSTRWAKLLNGIALIVGVLGMLLAFAAFGYNVDRLRFKSDTKARTDIFWINSLGMGISALVLLIIDIILAIQLYSLYKICNTAKPVYTPVGTTTDEEGEDVPLTQSAIGKPRFYTGTGTRLRANV